MYVRRGGISAPQAPPEVAGPPRGLNILSQIKFILADHSYLYKQIYAIISFYFNNKMS